MRRFNKVFGVGLTRTGTTSLSAALNILGISCIHWPKEIALFYRYRAATDITVACRFIELDKLFPGSLFIYTEREVKNWAEALVAHYQRARDISGLSEKRREMAEDAEVKIYGKTRPIDCDFQSKYRKHHSKIMRYFKCEPDRLLRMNIVCGEGWNKLCSFLNMPTPSSPFPHLHRRKRATIGANGRLASNLDG
jgi:Sulfotransferase domain